MPFGIRNNGSSLGTLIGLVLFFSITITNVPDSFANAGFTDVPISNEHYEAINFLRERGIVSGYTDNTFRPNQLINRAEALKIILLTSGIEIPDSVDKQGFLDVPKNSWFAVYIQEARKAQVIQGYPDGTFKPDQNVNLVEALKMLFLANSIDIASIEVTNSPFRDAYTNQWYIKYLVYADNYNLIVSDKNSRIFPGHAITRGEMADIMFKLIDVYRGLMPIQKLRAEQITSLFEHGTPEKDYGSAYTLGDGRGITAGSVGFTTGTGDAYEVIKRYTNRNPGNVLAGYLPELERLAESSSDDTSGLEGYVEAWEEAAEDSLFTTIQDELADEYYFSPAMDYADRLGLSLPLSRAVLYDTAIQHGNGGDPDSLSAIIDRTNSLMGGSPAEGKEEGPWLAVFLQVRSEVLLNAYNESTRETWAESVGRVWVFSKILEEGNVELQSPIVINTEVYHGTI